MSIQKVAYDGHTLIDLTQDTAVESDVANGKWFHKANGERVQGTASGGITPTGTINITQNGTVNVTNYAAANVQVSGSGSAVFPGSVMVTFVSNVGGSPTIPYAYRAASQSVPTNVVWAFGLYDPDDPQDVFINIAANVAQVRDGFYVFVHDDQWIEVTNAVYLHCASFNPLDDSLAIYGIGDDYNVYYVIPTSSTCTITVTDGSD